MQRDNYFEQSGLWGEQPEPYQIHVRADILNMLPKDAESILDIGCGDGFITNSLPANLRVTGMDISEEAIRYVKKEKEIGSITDIPFPDKSFDLVMANDVIEHLPEEQYKKALSELKRVAAKYILITVPYNEDLLSKQAKCADCGTLYHINRHYRNFNELIMADLFDNDLKPSEIRFSGDYTRPAFDPTAAIRHQFNIFYTWRNTKCPSCDSIKQVEIAPSDDGLLFLLDEVRSVVWAKNLHAYGTWNIRSEMIALYTREKHIPSDAPVIYGKKESLSKIDFSNPLQIASPDFSPGSPWARFWLPPEAEITENGVRAKNKSDTPLVIPLRLPVESKAGDRILLHGSGDKDARMRLYRISAGGHEHLLCDILAYANHRAEIAVNEVWMPDKFGLALAVYLDGSSMLHSLEYIPADEGAAHAPFVSVKKGHNVIYLGCDAFIWSWGLFSERQGRMPIIKWDQWKGSETAYSLNITDILKTIGYQHVPMANEIHTAKGILDAIEQQRTIAENVSLALSQEHQILRQHLADTHTTLQQTQAQLADTQAQLLKTHAQLADAQDQLADTRAQLADTRLQLSRRVGIIGGLKEISRNIKRKLLGPRLEQPQIIFPPPWKKLNLSPPVVEGQRRVLVISHMFPHPDQPSSGPFVFEQVKALRTHENIDARVLVGRPFWFTQGKHPVFALRLFKHFKLYHSASCWWDIRGVPVKYLPYKIIAPFWSHGWMYRSSLSHEIENLHAEFPFDIVHAHTSYLDGSAGLSIARKFNVPLVITEHTGPFSLLTQNPVVKKWTLKALNKASSVIAVSTFQNRVVSEHITSERQNKAQVIPNGVDTDLFYPPKEWLPDPKAPRILFVGFWVPIKNVPLLLNAFAIVKNKIPGARLKLVGGGEVKQQEADLHDLIKDMQLEKYTDVLGFQTKEEVARIMREECDLLVLCSKAETFGCVVIEALASGKPVVSTMCGGPEDIITKPYLGELCENENPDALAEAIIRAAGRIKNYSPQIIRKYAVENYGYKEITRQLAQLYESV